MISLSPIFSNHAVLQRDRPVKVWGEISSITGKNCLVKCLLQKEEQAILSGEITLRYDEDKDTYLFDTILSAQHAGGPYDLCVVCYVDELGPAESISISDVYFGDVYLVAGQSNMEYRLCNDQEVKNNRERDFDYPLIRSFRVPRVDYQGAIPEKNQDNNTWSVLTNQTAGNFSAVSYYFARSIFAKFEGSVPIGLIDSNRGGTSASTWVDEACLQNDSDLKIYLKEYQTLLAGLDIKQNKQDHEAYYENLAVYNEKAEKIAKKELSWSEIEKEIGPFPWPPPSGPFAYRSPSTLYHTMIEPFVAFEIRAVLYYQGEEDVPRCQLYKKLLRALIVLWRDKFRQKLLPFVIVQIAPFDDTNDVDNRAAYLKLAQSQVADEMDNVSLVVTTDCGSKDDIHPASKRVIGERLSLSVQKNVFGEKIIAEGPKMTVVRTNHHDIIVSFFTQGAGLVFGINGDEEPLGFEIAEDTGPWVFANAKIHGDDVHLSSVDVNHPTQVRYAFGRYVPANLYNRLGLPAIMFSTQV